VVLKREKGVKSEKIINLREVCEFLLRNQFILKKSKFEIKDC